MPKSPNGEKRVADLVGLAVMVGRIATGEIEDERDGVASAAAQLGSYKRGRAGGGRAQYRRAGADTGGGSFAGPTTR